jgi:hypothetical protein
MSINDYLIGEGATEWWLSEIRNNEKVNKESKEPKCGTSDSCRAKQKGRCSYCQKQVHPKKET